MADTTLEKKSMGVGKMLGLGCLGLFGLFVGLGVIGSMLGDSSTPSTSSTSPTDTGTDVPAPEAKAPEKTEYGVGDTIKLKDHEVVIASVDKDYSSGNMFDTPSSSENTYVLVDVAITNTGKNPMSVDSYSFKLEDETGTQRNDVLAITDGRLQNVTLAPGGKTSGKITFEAKKNSSTLKLLYSPGFFSSDIVINL